MLLMITAMSCNTGTLDADEEKLGTAYFPLVEGSFNIYDVEEISYSILGTIDTTKYELKELVTSSFEDNSEKVYILHRFSRESEDDNWTLDSAWTARNSTVQAIVVENNVPFVKLTFPIEEGRIWNGNSLNSLSNEDYVMVNVSRPYEIGESSFDETLKVIQTDNEDSVINLDRRIEVYGAGIGLLYREKSNIQWCSDPDCILQKIISSGTVFRQSYKTSGNE